MKELENLCLELLKQMGVGYNISKMYPPGHPTYERIAEGTVEIQLKFPPKLRTISLYFFENVVLFEDLRIDISKIPAIYSLAKHFLRTKIESISIDRDATKEEWKAFYEVLSLPLKNFQQVDDPTQFLIQRGVERIRFNEVKFSLKSTGQEKEVKFDLEAILNEIERSDSPEKIIESAPGETLAEKTKNIIMGSEKLNPVVLSKIFSTLATKESSTFMQALADEEIRTKVRELMESMDENDFILLFSSIPPESRKEIISLLPEEKKEKIVSKIPAFISGDEKGSDIDKKIDDIVQKFDELREEDKEREIREIFMRMTGINISETGEPEKLKDIVLSLKIVASYLLEKYGEEGFSGLSLIVSQVLKMLAPQLKDRFISQAEKYKEIGEAIRKVINEMSDEELVSLMSGI